MIAAQLALLQDDYARGNDPLSQEAFDSIEGLRAGMQTEVYALVRRRGEYGATTDEIEQALAGRHQSVSPRVIELTRAGLLKRTEATRPTRSGRKAHVYVVTR